MKKTIQTDKAPKAIGPYSQAIDVNNTLYVSGQVPIDPSTNEVVPGGIREQTVQVLKNISTILSAAGYNLSDVVKISCILTDMQNFADMNEVYATYFIKDFPARVTFQAVALPRKVMVEMDVIAVKHFD